LRRAGTETTNSVPNTQGNHDVGLGGWIYRISAQGVELFCAAHGIKGNYLQAFLDPKATFIISEPIPLVGNFGLVSSLPETAAEPTTDT
jgi:hypothetical protein